MTQLVRIGEVAINPLHVTTITEWGSGSDKHVEIRTTTGPVLTVEPFDAVVDAVERGLR